MKKTKILCLLIGSLFLIQLAFLKMPFAMSHELIAGPTSNLESVVQTDAVSKLRIQKICAYAPVKFTEDPDNAYAIYIYGKLKLAYKSNIRVHLYAQCLYHLKVHPNDPTYTTSYRAAPVDLFDYSTTALHSSNNVSWYYEYWSESLSPQGKMVNETFAEGITTRNSFANARTDFYKNGLLYLGVYTSRRTIAATQEFAALLTVFVNKAKALEYEAGIYSSSDQRYLFVKTVQIIAEFEYEIYNPYTRTWEVIINHEIVQGDGYGTGDVGTVYFVPGIVDETNHVDDTVRDTDNDNIKNYNEIYGTPSTNPYNLKWNLMYYLDGDNNLEEVIEDHYDEIHSAVMNNLPHNNIAITVCIDTDDRDEDHVPTKYFSGETLSSWIDKGELNMGDKNTLLNYVTWAQTTYPADNYALILNNHGSGINTNHLGNVDTAQKGVCYDDTSSNDYLFASEIYDALLGKDIDVLAMDACLMANLDFIREIGLSCDYYVASERLILLPGFPDFSISDWLLKNPNTTPSQFSDRITYEFWNYWKDMIIVIESSDPDGNLIYTNKYVNSTISAIDISKISLLLNSMNILVAELLETANVGLMKGPISNWVINRAEMVGSLGSDRSMSTAAEYLDLGNFTDFLIEYATDHAYTEILSKAQNVKNAITTAVIANRPSCWFGRNAGYTGMSIYYPDIWEDCIFNPIYTGGTWYRSIQLCIATNWDDYLYTYLQ